MNEVTDIGYEFQGMRKQRIGDGAPALPPPTMTGWLHAVLNYAKEQNITIVTPEKMEQLNAAEALCRTWGKQFADFDAKVIADETAWSNAVQTGGTSDPPRSAELVRAQRNNMEKLQGNAIYGPCLTCKAILEGVWQRIAATGFEYATVLDAREQEFYAQQGITGWAPQAGAGVRRHIQIRSPKPFKWHQPPPSPGDAAGDLGITLTP